VRGPKARPMTPNGPAFVGDQHWRGESASSEQAELVKLSSIRGVHDGRHNCSSEGGIGVAHGGEIVVHKSDRAPCFAGSYRWWKAPSKVECADVFAAGRSGA